MLLAEQEKAETRPNEGRELYLQVRNLRGQVEKIRHWLPWEAWRSLRRCRKEREALYLQYEKYVVETEHAQGGGPRFASPESLFAETPADGRFGGRALGSLVVIMQEWSGLDAALDRKASYALALFSFYFAVVSLVVSLVYPLI
jgi:hypothetical protein